MLPPKTPTVISVPIKRLNRSTLNESVAMPPPCWSCALRRGRGGGGDVGRGGGGALFVKLHAIFSIVSIAPAKFRNFSRPLRRTAAASDKDAERGEISFSRAQIAPENAYSKRRRRRLKTSSSLAAPPSIVQQPPRCHAFHNKYDQPQKKIRLCSTTNRRMSRLFSSTFFASSGVRCSNLAGRPRASATIR